MRNPQLSTLPIPVTPHPDFSTKYVRTQMHLQTASSSSRARPLLVHPLFSNLSIFSNPPQMLTVMSSVVFKSSKLPSALPPTSSARNSKVCVCCLALQSWYSHSHSQQRHGHRSPKASSRCLREVRSDIPHVYFRLRLAASHLLTSPRKLYFPTHP